MTHPTTTKQTSPDAEAATFRIWTGIPVLSLVYYKLGMWLDSPLLVMAGRARLGGARAQWVLPQLFLIVALPAIIFFSASIISVAESSHSYYSPYNVFWPYNFVAILGGVLTLVLAGVAIAGEKEKQTLEALFVTPLSSARIVFGKFVLAVCPALLLQAFLLPGIILAIAIGGAIPWHLLAFQVHLLTMVLALGSIGVLCSSRSRNTVTGVITALVTGWLWTLVCRYLGPLILISGELAFSDIMEWLLLMALPFAIQLLIACLYFYLTVRHLTSLRSGRKAAMPLFADR